MHDNIAVIIKTLNFISTWSFIKISRLGTLLLSFRKANNSFDQRRQLKLLQSVSLFCGSSWISNWKLNGKVKKNISVTSSIRIKTGQTLVK